MKLLSKFLGIKNVIKEDIPNLTDVLAGDEEDETPIPKITKPGIGTQDTQLAVPQGTVAGKRGARQGSKPGERAGTPTFQLPHSVAVDVAAAARNSGISFAQRQSGPGEWVFGSWAGHPEKLQKMYQYIQSKLQQAKTQG